MKKKYKYLIFWFLYFIIHSLVIFKVKGADSGFYFMSMLFCIVMFSYEEHL